MRFDERKKQILQAITVDYISTAEPVGSRSIARRYNLGISPATIRNEMSDLEEGGYIQQPHASSGRIPSDKGYRFYVDSLLHVTSLDQGEEGRVRDEYDKRRRDVETVLATTSRMLSQMTKYTGMVSGPHSKKARFRHIQLISLDENTVLVVLVTDPGLVENRIIECPAGMPPEELERISSSLNRRLRGLSVDDLTASVLEEVRDEVVNHHFLDEALSLIHRSLEHKGSERVFLDGSSNVLNQPEFRDLDKAKALLGMLEHEEYVLSLLDDSCRASGVQISIGHENRRVEMRECSVVTASYQIGGEVVGTIAVLGPTRMEYEKVITVVRFIAESLSELLTRLSAGGP